MGGVKPEPDEALTMQIDFAIWLKTQPENPFCPSSGWGKKYCDGFKPHFIEGTPYHFIVDDLSLPPVIGTQYECQVCIAIFILEASPTCELTIDQDSPGAISILLPLLIFSRYPFSAFVFIEAVVRKWHLAPNKVIGIERNDLSTIDLAQVFELKMHNRLLFVLPNVCVTG
jgi:hypothetical protein